MVQKSIKFDFNNSNGEKLSGRLELPSAEPQAFAIFAHCFTCSKNLMVVNRLTKKLSDLGIATLRFDFTGLGNSEGDFANTNFSSNVDDLRSAYEALAKEYSAPKLLIGHSLGGAAVLHSQHLFPELKAVVTIGAPSDVSHVSHLFEKDIPKINEQGEAVVNLAGREFKIKKQFIEDIKEKNILEELSKSKKAFLVMHSPIDDTVSIDHAAKIYGAVKHPKSFVSLDTADHLVSNPDDAIYIASMISTWVSRYIPLNEQKPSFSGEVLVTNRKGHQFTHDIYSKDHYIVADEPKSVKGDNLGMNPYELLLSGLGACTAMTMKMYAARKKINLTDVTVELSHKKDYATDCETCDGEKKYLDHIEKTIKIEGDFDEAQRTRLLEIAEKCPVNKTLKSEIIITSKH